MEYIEVIEKIVGAEKSARDAVASAKEKEARLDELIAAETEVLRNKYRKLAEDKILEAEQTEIERTQSELAKLEADYLHDLEHMDRTFRLFYDEWKLRSLRIITGE